MSAIRFTASVTSASSSGRIANSRKIGLAAIGADHVAEQAQAVVVGPLEVVDQDGERPLGGEGAERDGAEIEGAEQPAVGRERREPGVVLARHRVEARARAPRRSRVGRAALDRRGRPDDRAREQERAAELLVGGDGDRREPRGRGHLAGGEQQAGLADARLALEREPGEPAGAGRGELLRIASCSARPSDDGAGGPVDVQRHRREGKRSVVVCDHSVSVGLVVGVGK